MLIFIGVFLYIHDIVVYIAFCQIFIAIMNERCNDAKETPNNVSGGGGLAAEAQLFTVARLEAVYIGGNRGCSEIFLCRFRD